MKALLRLDLPADEAGWWRQPLCGVNVLLRQLAGLRRRGVTRVSVACAADEMEAVRRLTESFAGDRRLHGLRVEVGGEPSPADLLLDGRVLFRGGQPGPRIDSAAGRAEAERELMACLAKPTDGWFSLHLNRPISLRLSRRLAPYPISPDVLTGLTLLVGLASALVSARGTALGFVAGAALFQLASVLDGVDGEIARLKLLESPHGEWLDTICDDLTNLAYLGGLTVGLARSGASRWLVEAGIVAMVLDVAIVAFLYWRIVARLGGRSLLAFQGELDRPDFLARPGARLLRAGQRLVKRDAYGIAFLLFALLGVPWLSVVGTAVALAVGLPAVIAIEIAALRRAAA